MSILMIETPQLIQDVAVTDNELIVNLLDGRVISTPLIWYPRLLQANTRERNNFVLLGDGEGIHWPDLDEDISLEGIIDGRSSGES